MTAPGTLILFVDDDLVYMYPTVDRLEAEGYQVECMPGPDEAVEWLQQGNVPHLLICDLMMFREPDESLEKARRAGFDLIKTARGDWELDCPVVILTGVLVEDILEEAKRITKPNWVVTKPTSQEHLLRIVREALKSSTAGR